MKEKQYRILVTAWYPSLNKTRRKWVKTPLNGTLNGSKLGLAAPVQLHPGMMINRSKEVMVDAEACLQVNYNGLGKWIGPDPRAEYAAKVKQVNRELQTRGYDWQKLVWPLIVFVGICFAALIAALMFSVK